MRSAFILLFGIVVGCGGNQFQGETIAPIDDAGGVDAAPPRDDATPANDTTLIDAIASADARTDARTDAPSSADIEQPRDTSSPPADVETPRDTSSPPDASSPPADVAVGIDGADAFPPCDLRPCMCGSHVALCCNGPCPPGFEGLTCYCGDCRFPQKYNPDAGTCE